MVERMNGIKPVEWKAFSEELPVEGSEIVLAVIDEVATTTGHENKIIEISIPFKACAHEIQEHWTHWCPATVFPPIPLPKKCDYCMEAWEKLPFFHNPITGPDDFRLRRIDLPRGSCGVTLEFYRIIWDSAIACVKEHGLEKM